MALTKKLICISCILWGMYLFADIPFTQFMETSSHALISFSDISSHTDILNKQLVIVEITPYTHTGSQVLKITPEKTGSSITFPCISIPFDRESKDTEVCSIILKLCAHGSDPITFNITFTFDNNRTSSMRHITAYPDEWRHVKLQRPHLGIPRAITFDFHHASGSSLLIEAVNAQINIYRINDLEASIDTYPEVWEKHLSDNSTEDIKKTMAILAKVGTANALNILSDTLDSPRVGLYAFTFIDTLSPALKKYICENKLKSNRPSTVALAATLLRSGKDWETTDLLLETIKSSSTIVQETAGVVLCGLEDYSIIEKYIEMLRNPSQSVKLNALVALMSLRPLNVLPLLTPLINEDRNLSRAATHVIGAIKNPRCIDPLFRAAQYPDLSLIAAHYLRQYNLDDHISRINTLALSFSPETREAAAYLFGATISKRPGRSEMALKLLIKDISPRVRARAASSFAEASSPKFLRYLHAMLNDPSTMAMISAVRAIGKVGNYKSLFYLSNLLSKCNQLVSYAVKEEIVTMQERVPRYSPPSLPEFTRFRRGEQISGKGIFIFRRGFSHPLSENPVPYAHEVIKDKSIHSFFLQGYVEPLAFSVYSSEDILEQRIEVTDFISKAAHTLKKKDIEIFIEEEKDGKRFLEKRSFIYKLPRNQSCRIWIFFDISDDVPTGIYRGTISLLPSIHLKASITVLPWRLKNSQKIIFSLPSEPLRYDLEKRIISKNFSYSYLTIDDLYAEDDTLTPLFPSLLSKLSKIKFPAIVNLDRVISSGNPASKDSFLFHVSPLHKRRLLKTIQLLQSFCRENELPRPLYLVNSPEYGNDSDKQNITGEAIRTIRDISGTKTVCFASEGQIHTTGSDIIIQTSGELNLRTLESLYENGQELFFVSDVSTPSSDVRKRTGLYLWLTESNGHVFLYNRSRERNVNAVETIPLQLVMAAEGIKDLEYLTYLETLVKKVRNSATDFEKIRFVLNIEEKLYKIKCGLSPYFDDPSWRDINSDSIRNFLQTACLILYEGIDIE